MIAFRRMMTKYFLYLLWMPFLLQNLNQMSPEERARIDAQNAELKQIVQHATKLPHQRAELKVTPLQAEWQMGMVSWVAADKNGLIYLLQRGDKADPVVVVNREGKVVRSWGKGMYTMPHAIRIDPQGNVWTTDAASSMVYKFSPEGRKLMQIEVGGQPTPCRNNFCSTTDVAFAPNGNIFISDGYANARVLEYTPDGKKVREWGAAGNGPGQFRLPHSIQVDENGIVYVADRENGRVQLFDMQGKFLREWPKYGKTFGLKLDKDAVWLSTIPRGPNGTPGWLMKVDRRNGQVLGYVDSEGNHGMDVLATGELVQGPGPEQKPQFYRMPR
ncbi:MAG: 6-bladed beta-propeller [Acidobacteria bacterium]|nr:6-bladed beta-propeller [Acidobacteriota bacterium]